jgi:hypothetical protein
MSDATTATAPAALPAGAPPKKWTAEEVIVNGGYAFCRACYDAFRRVRPTLRYCATCGNGFCEGEHGNFARGFGTCVVCGVRKDYRNAAQHEHPKGLLIPGLPT